MMTVTLATETKRTKYKNRLIYMFSFGIWILKGLDIGTMQDVFKDDNSQAITCHVE